MFSLKYRSLYRLAEFFQKLVTIPTFPNTLPLTTKYFYKAAKSLQYQEKFNLVVSEHHGLESLLTGCRLMRDDRELKHIALFWDPLKGQMATKRLPKSYTDKCINNIECFVDKYTSRQISMMSMQRFHKENGDVARDRRIYLDIPSVIKPEEEVPTDKLCLLKNDSINIIFSGLLSPYYRDALPIIRLFNQCDYADRLNLIFFSKGENELIENEAKDFKGTLICHEYIPLRELHTMYHHADFLLNISHINANMVPSKIFEYMSYGRPIISTYLTRGDMAQKYVSRYEEGLCIDLNNANSDNLNLLNNFLNRKHYIIPFERVKEEFVDNTPERYLEVIDNTL